MNDIEGKWELSFVFLFFFHDTKTVGYPAKLPDSKIISISGKTNKKPLLIIVVGKNLNASKASE